MSALESFRRETADWLEKNCPPSLRGPGPVPSGGRRETWSDPEARLWLDRMLERGFTAPTWPEHAGGAGLSGAEARVLRDEMKRLGCRKAIESAGLSMLGPVLLEFGTEAQQREHLPPIARGEIAWCQGYSEPGAGSDLASLQTRCVPADDGGDHYVVTGQKIWTSGADEADWMFCLVRTDPDARKHDGISFVLFDMQSQGVTVKPILLISGRSPFCETFLDNVRVPKRDLVGPWNGGWTIAKRLLQHERSMIGSPNFSLFGGRGGETVPESALRYVGARDGRIADAATRTAVAQEAMDRECYRLTRQRSADEAKAGHAPGAASSLFKLYSTELNQRKYDLLTRILGPQALGWEGDGFDERELRTTREWLRSRGNTIEGGTSEIQLGIIAKRVLGLPDA